MLLDPLVLLQSLGKNADEIAASLQASGIKGRRKSDQSCPLACFLRQQNTWERIAVFEDYLCCRTAGGELTKKWNMPRACQRFIERFDQGGFPELEDKSWLPAC